MHVFKNQFAPHKIAYILLKLGSGFMTRDRRSADYHKMALYVDVHAKGVCEAP